MTALPAKRKRRLAGVLPLARSRAELGKVTMFEFAVELLAGALGLFEAVIDGLTCAEGLVIGPMTYSGGPDEALLEGRTEGWMVAGVDAGLPEEQAENNRLNRLNLDRERNCDM